MDSPLSMLSSERDQRLHLSGTRIDSRRNDPKTYSDGRVCEARDCRTILSRYNGQSRFNTRSCVPTSCGEDADLPRSRSCATLASAPERSARPPQPFCGATTPKARPVI
jgi:hypothetical protein